MRDEDAPFGTTLLLDAASYVDSGSGRFFNASQINAVQAFFTSELLNDFEGTELRLTRTELAERLSLSDSDFGTGIRQFSLGVDEVDYAARTFIFNSTGFTIDDRTEVEFVIQRTAEGTIRTIENLRLVPFNDNFDFDTNSLATTLGNPILQAQVDPQNLGQNATYCLPKLLEASVSF